MLKQFSADDLQVIAIAQEQHAERTRLYKQWKQLDWLILQDSFCELGITAVPMLIPLDEEGRVVALRANEGFIKKWVAGDVQTNGVGSSQANDETADVSQLVHSGDELIKFGKEADRIDKAIDAYQKARELSPDAAELYFRLGVAYRMRFDAEQQAGDFELAVENWMKALQRDPNQYIFRRRIEQYGPRLMKPYPFYDWVEGAVADIQKRGEQPVELTVSLSGAEIAKPSRSFTAANANAEPDPEGKINRDEQGLIDMRPIIVPGTIRPGRTGRVHVVLTPSGKAKWNNESGPTKIWVESSESIELTDQVLAAQQPADVTSDEARSFEFELKLSRDAQPGQKLRGYALYYVCRDADGVCQYLRKDFEVEIH